jgi:hypothetical protein
LEAVLVLIALAAEPVVTGESIGTRRRLNRVDPPPARIL